jgi:amidophosphoribosyltransferase
LSEYRRKLGIKLSEEFPDLKADFVIWIPNSGIPAAKGFASAKNIPYLEELFIDPKYEGDRSFISPEEQRKVVARNKFLLKSNNLNWKKIIIIDDSIIRWTVLTVICELFREAGVSEIHICSSLPPVMDICDLGIFLPTKNELLLWNNSDYSTAASKVGATSINFLSLDGLKDVLGKEICTGCLGEEYPF